MNRTPSEQWGAALLEASASDVSIRLGERYPVALVSMNCGQAASAWGRAPAPLDPTPWRGPERLTRARSLSCLARALRGQNREGEVWRKALAAVPSGRSGALVDLLLRIPLLDAELRGAVRERVTKTSADVFGAAAIAWYLARTGAAEDELLGRAQRAWDDADADGPGDDGFRVALAAALWCIGSSSTGPRDFVLEAINGPAITGLPAFAVRAAMAAAVASGQLHEVAESVIIHAGALGLELVEAFATSAQADEAARIAPQIAGAMALLARLLPDDARAATWRADAERRDLDLDGHLEEGLVTEAEVKTARLELAALHASLGNVEGARATVRTLASRARDQQVAASESARARFEQGAPPGGARWFTAEGGVELEQAIGTWRAAPDRRARLKVRRFADQVLAASAAFSRRGDRERGRVLLDVVVDADSEVPWISEAELVAAWVCLGELERALVHLQGTAPTAGAVAALIPALVEAGRRREAIDTLEDAIRRAITSENLFTLVPAVLAVSDDRRACCAELLAAVDEANAGLASLLPPAP